MLPAKLAFLPPIPLDDIALNIFIRMRLTQLRHFEWTAARPPPEIVVDALNRCSQLSLFSAWTPGAASAVTEDYPDASFVRWDGLSLPLLPLDALVSLRLQNLSVDGVQCLHSILPALTACETLELEHSLFVDDALLFGVADSLHKLRSFAIRHMAGTKVTNKGMAAIMEGLHAFEELELTEFEGALLGNLGVCGLADTARVLLFSQGV